MKLAKEEPILVWFFILLLYFYSLYSTYHSPINSYLTYCHKKLVQRLVKMLLEMGSWSHGEKEFKNGHKSG